jgi:hypothetical protein
MQPHDVQREGFRWLPTVIFVIVVLAGICAGLAIANQNIEFWLQNRDVNHQNQVYQNSYGTQQSDIASMRTAIGAVASADDSAQVKADVSEACGFAASITSMPAAYKGWVAQNCLAGAISPGSPYSK